MNNQISTEEMQRRSALLKQAKQILLQEYAATRTQQHQQWIRDSETSWRTNGVLMAYPPGNLYPTEQEIVNKALELYNKSLMPTIPEIKLQDEVATIFNSTVSNSTAPTDLPATVTEQLEAVYKKGSTYPKLVEELLSTPIDKYVETIIDPVQPDKTEPIVDVSVPVDEIDNSDIESSIEPQVEYTEDQINNDTDEEPTTPKHSLLRSVLSGWLSKNKDKET